MNRDVKTMELAPSFFAEPFGMMDAEELPEAYGIDDVFMLYQSPDWVFVYWELTKHGLENAAKQFGGAFKAERRVLRMVTVATDFTLPITETQRQINDHPVDWNHGQKYLQVPMAGSRVRIAAGLLSEEGYFVSIVESPWVQLPPPQGQTKVSRQFLGAESFLPKDPASRRRLLQRRMKVREIVAFPKEWEGTVSMDWAGDAEMRRSLGHGSGGIC